jgi:hypothetical protein
MNKINENKISGYVMAAVGSAMILANAIGYIFNLDITSSAFSILGIVFLVMGMKLVRK